MILFRVVSSRNSLIVNTPQTTAAAISAIGPAYMTPSIPMKIGKITMSGSKKRICLVSDMKIPSCDLPIELKKFAVTGWMPLIKVKNI